MTKVRYFTCREMAERIESEGGMSLAKQMELFAQWEKAVGEIKGDTDIPGLKLDFNLGLRLCVPAGNWHVTIRDIAREALYFDEDVSDTTLISLDKYLICWQIEVFLEGRKVFAHEFYLSGQKVFIGFGSGALGDILAALPYARRFQEQYRCQVICCLPGYMEDLAAWLYPELGWSQSLPEDAYAAYYLGAWQGMSLGSPVDQRSCPLSLGAGYALGIPGVAHLPLYRPRGQRAIAERYVCIGVQASTPLKGWHYPLGWELIAAYLKELGYRVLCIDRDRRQEEAGYISEIPQGAEDFTGNISLLERAELLYHADFFIGLGSGLSWLAYNVGCPVILISGMSEPWYEFPTPYRVINYLVCHGCFQDSLDNFLDRPCPRYAGTERELECSKRITPQQVIGMIQRCRVALEV